MSAGSGKDLSRQGLAKSTVSPIHHVLSISP